MWKQFYPYATSIFQRKHEFILLQHFISLLFPHWIVMCTWNPSSWKTVTYLVVITRLLMTWWNEEPGHWQQWHCKLPFGVLGVLAPWESLPWACYHILFRLLTVTLVGPSLLWSRDHSRVAPSQWETLLQNKALSHWLGTNLGSALWSIVSFSL